MEKTRKELLQGQIADLLNNEAFCEAFFRCGNAENVSALLAEYGVEASAGEIDEFVRDGNAALAAMKDAPDGELSEEQLEEVAGGGVWRRIARGAVSVVGGAALGFGLGCICGVCPAFTPAAYTIAHAYAIGAGVWIATG